MTPRHPLTFQPALLDFSSTDNELATHQPVSMTVKDLYDRVRLSQADLKLMYPPANLYRNDLTLAIHLTCE